MDKTTDIHEKTAAPDQYAEIDDIAELAEAKREHEAVSEVDHDEIDGIELLRVAEMTQRVATRWAPRCLTAAAVMDIIQSYGYDNDSLSSEQYDENVVEWEIKIEIRQLGSHSWQQDEGSTDAALQKGYYTDQPTIEPRGTII